jgi:hypothetical protein
MDFMRSRRRHESDPTEAELRLRELIEREAAERTAELQRTLAIARAESASLLAQEERRLAEQRRREFADRERQATAEFSMRLGGGSGAGTTDPDRRARTSRAAAAAGGCRGGGTDRR